MLLKTHRRSHQTVSSTRAAEAAQIAPRSLRKVHFVAGVHNKVNIDLDVPKVHYAKIPSVVRYVAPTFQEAASRHKRVPLAFIGGPVVRKTVQVIYPATLPRVADHYVAVRRGTVVLHSTKSRLKLLRGEHNRKRYSERKAHRKAFGSGQLASLKRDRFGLLGASWRNDRTVRHMSGVAAVVRALGG